MTSTSPKYGVNAYSTPHNGVYADMDQVARTGGTGLGLFEGKFIDGEDEKVRDEMAAHGLAALYCVPTSHSILGIPFGPSSAKMPLTQRVDLICASIARLAKFDPVVIAVAPGTTGDPKRPAGPIEDIVAALPVIADTAVEYGVEIGLELLAERRGSPLFTLPDIVAVMDEVGRPNVGVLFDVFHSWPEPDLHEHIRKYASRINSVQVCDVKVDERSGHDRELPGLGRGVAPEIIATLIESGYDGWWELEVFSDDGTYFDNFPDSYWALPHEEFLAKSKAAFDVAYAAALRIVDERAGELP
jgi:sugar phosphate isomerase/epimerase